MNTQITRRSVLGLAGASAAALVAGCGTSGPAGTDPNKIALWTLQSDTENPVLDARVKPFNKTSKFDVVVQTFVNDPYKQKLQVSMGSPNAPDIFFNWGGGNLAQYVDANQVVDLTSLLDAHPEARDKWLPSVLDTAKIHGKQYGLPLSGMQPEILFYNKSVFDDAGAKPPETYDDLLKLVDLFKRKGVTPIALAGTQGWTELIYLMYFTDRIGGPEVVDNLAANKPHAWRDPAIKAAAEHCLELVNRGAFGDHYQSVNYDNSGASRLFATGKTAMHVMGTWEYQGQITNNPKFVKQGHMGWVPFPAVPGKGDPRDLVGAPTNYFSVTTRSDHPDVAAKFLVDALSSDSYIDGLVGIGEIPPVKDLKPKLAGSDAAAFTTFTYDLVTAAPSFQLAWDQALSPSIGEAVNTNLQKLFVKQLDADGFVDAMDQAK